MIRIERQAEVAIIGAGPIGLEMAAALKRRGIEYLHFDKGQIASTISWFPEDMTFFSSSDRIAIAGIPIQTVGQGKCMKEQYLAYLRSVALAYNLQVNTYEEVTHILREADGEFTLATRTRSGERFYRVGKVIACTGDMARPRRLDVPGEDLPHVSHYFRDPHPYFRQNVVVIGGRNSAAEAALRCWHAGAHVTMAYRGAEFDKKSVKYWILPELMGRINRGEMAAHFHTSVDSITPTHVRLLHRPPGGNEAIIDVPADFVLLLTGYVADMSLLAKAGVAMQGANQTPIFNEQTMETSVPGIYIAGTATAGTQPSYTVFIETCHVHVTRIANHLTGQAPPPAPQPVTVPES
jgi:thioredoxin reductase (NADPH)